MKELEIDIEALASRVADDVRQDLAGRITRVMVQQMRPVIEEVATRMAEQLTRSVSTVRMPHLGAPVVVLRIDGVDKAAMQFSPADDAVQQVYVPFDHPV